YRLRTGEVLPPAFSSPRFGEIAHSQISARTVAAQIQPQQYGRIESAGLPVLELVVIGMEIAAANREVVAERIGARHDESGEIGCAVEPGITHLPRIEAPTQGQRSLRTRRH